MSKKDLNYIKLTRKVVKDEQMKAVNQHRWNEMHRMASISVSESGDRERLHKERCQEAAGMTNYERLVNYAGTRDATYLGEGCKWDVLEKLGLKKKRGL